MKKNSCSICIIIMLAMFLPACSKSGLKGLVPASGTIMFKEEPVDNATILFSPVDRQGEQRSASAKSDASGKFQMKTEQPGDGVFPGEYKVVIKKTQSSGGTMIPGTEDNPKFIDDRTTVHLLPQKYGDFSTTNLTVTIPPQGDKALQFTLEGEANLTPIPLKGPKR